MPYMLADLGRIFNPTLCIIDGLIGQAGREWGNGRNEGPHPDRQYPNCGAIIPLPRMPARPISWGMIPRVIG